jgi:hypothetical protein
VEQDAIVTGIAIKVDTWHVAIAIEEQKATRHVSLLSMTTFPMQEAAAESAKEIVTVKRVVIILVENAANMQGRKWMVSVTNLTIMSVTS